jgi:tetratricopeptide (TPR) repeat protein
MAAAVLAQDQAPAPAPPAPMPPATAPAPPDATAAAPVVAPSADFDQRMSRMLSAAWLADLFVFTLDKDISDEGYESVMQLARRCAALAPDRRPAWDMVLVLADQIESGKPDLAREARREALAALAKLDPADDVVRLARVGDAIDAHPTAEARVRAYEAVLAPQHRSSIGAPVAARLAYQLASLESRIGNTELFARWLGDAVKTDPSFPAAAQAAAGFFRMRVNDPAADVELLSIALDANPRDLSTWSAMLTVLLDGGAFRGAERIARLAIAVADAERRPETTYALTGDLATALWGSGQRDAALRELELRMGRLTDEYRRNISLQDPSITVERLNREFPPLPSSLSIAMLALNQAKGRTAEVASLVERAGRGTDAEVRRAEMQGARPEEIGALELQRATTALLFAKDVSGVPAMLEKAAKAGALGAEARTRFDAMIDWRQGRTDKAMAALEPMRASDPLAQFVYASLLQESKRLPEAAKEFRTLAQGAVGTSLGLLSLDRLAQCLGQEAILTSQLAAPIADRAKALDDALDRSLPRAIDAIVEAPMRALVVDLEPSATNIAPYQPLSFRLRLRNDSRLPLAIGNDAPISGKVTLRAAASRAGQNEPPELPQQPILIDRRLRLEPGASIDVTIDADLTAIGLLLNVYPLDPHLINVAFVTNPASATGGYAPGFMGTVTSSPPIQSSGVNVTEAWVRESLEAIKVPGSVDAVQRIALLAHAAAVEDRIPAAMKAEIPAIWDAVLKAWTALPDRAKAWVVAGLPKETPAMAPLLDAVRASPAPEVLSSWAITRVADPTDPMLDVCRRSGDETLATFADATKWVLERRAKRAIEEVGIEADRKRSAPLPAGAKP